MADRTTVVAFAAVVGGVSLLSVAARWFRQRDELPSPESWALAGRQFGSVLTWFLVGGTIYTAYTFAAVPGLVYGAGALGFFALPYTIVICPLAFVFLPRLAEMARDNGYVTVGDFVRARYDSPLLALVVALTGIVATMPYIALQLVGIRAVLAAGGLYPAGVRGDLVLAAVFAVLAAATYTNGLRAPALISVAKGLLVFVAVSTVVGFVLAELGSPGEIFEAARERSAADGRLAAPPLTLDSSMFSAFGSLVLGSALALVVYPHVLTAAFAAKNSDVLRRSAAALPGWTGVLGLLGLLGVAALAAGIQAPRGQAEVAVPLLVQMVSPPLVTGVVFGTLVVAALVPAAVMSVAVAMLFVRNVYVEYFHPTATPKHQVRVARLVSLVTKIGAFAFVLALRDQAAINLQLLGGVWILQTFPAVAIGVFTTWLHRGALLAGWAVGMVAGTFLVASGSFAAVVTVDVGTGTLPLYTALIALGVNVSVAAALTPFLDRLGLDRGARTVLVAPATGTALRGQE